MEMHALNSQSVFWKKKENPQLPSVIVRFLESSRVAFVGCDSTAPARRRHEEPSEEKISVQGENKKRPCGRPNPG